MILLVLSPDLVYPLPKSGLMTIAQGFKIGNVDIGNVSLKVVFVCFVFLPGVNRGLVTGLISFPFVICPLL